MDEGSFGQLAQFGREGETSLHVVVETHPEMQLRQVRAHGVDGDAKPSGGFFARPGQANGPEYLQLPDRWYELPPTQREFHALYC